MLISQCHFDGTLSSSWVLCRAAEANGLPEAHKPPKVHGPRGHSTPIPHSRWPWWEALQFFCDKPLQE